MPPKKPMWIFIMALLIIEKSGSNPDVHKLMNAETNVVHPYNEILCTLKKYTTDLLHNMDGLWKHSKWKKSGTNGHVLHDSTYIKCSD